MCLVQQVAVYTNVDNVGTQRRRMFPAGWNVNICLTAASATGTQTGQGRSHTGKQWATYPRSWGTKHDIWENRSKIVMPAVCV